MTAVASTFAEGHVDADGLHIRYLHAGTGRLVGLEVPGFGHSPANARTQSYPELAATLATAARGLGLDRFNLWGSSAGGVLAVWLAIGNPEMIEALVLEAPDASVPEEKLASLHVPTLVVFGTRDGAVPPGRVYRAKMPNCNYVLVYNAGHEVGAERPEAFTSLVSDFLERREAFIVSQKSSLLNP